VITGWRWARASSPALGRGTDELLEVRQRHRRRRMPPQHKHDFRRVAVLLNRDGGDPGEGRHRAVRVPHSDHVAEREHLRVAPQREVWRDHDPSGPVELSAGQFA
jgi:hypothetical protein